MKRKKCHNLNIYKKMKNANDFRLIFQVFDFPNDFINIIFLPRV